MFSWLPDMFRLSLHEGSGPIRFPYIASADAVLELISGFGQLAFLYMWLPRLLFVSHALQ